MQSDASTPKEYLTELEEPRRTEIRTLHELIRRAAPELAPIMTSGMLGYGEFHYKYASGREGDTALIALASQKRYISLYVLCNSDGAYLAESYQDRLPNADIGKSCIRFKRVSDVDLGIIEDLVREAAKLGPPVSE